MKLMNYGKWSYEQSQKERETRRKQRATEHTIKEVQFRLKIEDHDYNTKLTHAKKFIETGHDVKVVVTMRGRERSHPEIADRLMARVVEDLTPAGEKNPPVAREGARLSAVVRTPRK